MEEIAKQWPLLAVVLGALGTVFTLYLNTQKDKEKLYQQAIDKAEKNAADLLKTQLALEMFMDALQKENATKSDISQMSHSIDSTLKIEFQNMKMFINDVFKNN